VRKIIVGSRQSALALTQTGHVIADLERIAAQMGLDVTFEVKKIVTKGDQILDVTLSKVGGKGLFVKEIEQALLDGEIDLAVHSMKDVPSELPFGLIIGAVPKREDARDCLITRDGGSFEQLPQGAVVGTSSLRRSSQLQHLRPDLQIVSIRGNIDTRIQKLHSENMDAIVLAAAGLHRMGWADRISSYIAETACIPAVGQGSLGIECREDDEAIMCLLAAYNHMPTRTTVDAERAFLLQINGGCQVPIGAYATLDADETIHLTGIVGSPDGNVLLKATMIGNDPEDLGKRVAQQLQADGAEQILSQVRG
jgi:hydroxymethylbilane synthase